MPLIPPSLDDRSYDDLVQDLLANIPAHTPEWTNPQPGDPGRTLLELFAWLADTILYRANLIPEKQRIAFLKLIGQSLNPAAAASGLVSLALDPAALAPQGLAAGAMITGPVPFETLGTLNLLPVTAQAYIKAKLTDAQKTEKMKLLSGLQNLYNLPSIPAGYTTTPVFVNNQADPVGIDLLNSTTDHSIWLALMAAKPENVDAIRKAIGGQYGEQLLSVGVAPSMEVPGLFANIGPPAAIQATWQMTRDDGSLSTLKSVLPDGTQGLTQSGVVQLMVPQTADIGTPTNNVRQDIQAGVGLKPPRIDDPAIAQKIVTWVRLSVQSALSLSWIGINAVSVDQRKTSKLIVIGVSDGTANQQFSLQQTQVDPASFQLDVDMPGLGFTPWNLVDDLAVLQGPSQAYTLDSEAGTVTFGDQLQGLIPPLGRRIRVRQMRAGGGAAGNLPAGSLAGIANAVDFSANLVTQKITVVQPLPTSGGADSETLDDAEQRIPSLMRHQNRAVTATDYSDLARQAPGANVERVEVMPLFKPQTRTPNVPGVVSVMVIPGKPGVLYPCPRADRTLLETVYQFLNPRRPVTSEMYVISSDYVTFGLAVAIEVRTGFSLPQVSQDVETAVRGYLWPIAPGGLDGTGWPLGRNVRSLELEVEVSKVPGVVEVNGITLFQLLPSGNYQAIAGVGSAAPEVQLQSWQLPELKVVTVAAGADGSGIAVPTSLTPAPETDPAIAVPLTKQVC